MAKSEQVTVDKAYFDALLRRADFHTSVQLHGQRKAPDVTISRTEYNSLLRSSREYDRLKEALFQGGVSQDTLDLLISGEHGDNQRNDSFIESSIPWDQNAKFSASLSPTGPNSSWKPNAAAASFDLSSTTNTLNNGALRLGPSRPQGSWYSRQVSYGLSSAAEDVAYDDTESFDDSNPAPMGGADERRTICLSGFSDSTTYRDVLSVIKGGKLLSIYMRSGRSAIVTFAASAADFLAWAKRNDIYLNSKRIEIRFSDRQYRLNGHIANKIASGATRNLVVHAALEKGLTEAKIRADMDHIHNLVIIDITFRSGDAYVAMNSVHNALFARTCMMSRSSYRGCKIGFMRDECDTPLPIRPQSARLTPPSTAAPKKTAVSNRFDLLNLDDTDASDGADDKMSSENGSCG